MPPCHGEGHLRAMISAFRAVSNLGLKIKIKIKKLKKHLLFLDKVSQCLDKMSFFQVGPLKVSLLMLITPFCTLIVI